MSLVVKCDICEEVDTTKNIGDTCSRCDKLALAADSKATKDMQDRCSSLEGCVNSIGMFVITIQRTNPEYWVNTFGEAVGGLAKAALEEYDAKD